MEIFFKNTISFVSGNSSFSVPVASESYDGQKGTEVCVCVRAVSYDFSIYFPEKVSD